LVPALALLALLGSLIAPVASAQDTTDLTQRQFTTLINDASAGDSAFGPEEGELEHDPDIISLADANVDLANVLVEVTFANPAAANRHNFDYGIQFRRVAGVFAARTLSFVMIETGEWALLDQGGNPIIDGAYDGINPDRDDENTMIVYADGTTVHLESTATMSGRLPSTTINPAMS